MRKERGKLERVYLAQYYTFYVADMSYWHELDEVMRGYCDVNDLPYVRNDDSMKRDFDAPPVVVNYFYHSEIVRHKKSPRP